MNILAIDYGRKKIGLAWLQTGLDIVLPFGQIQTKRFKYELPKLIREERIDKAIVGLPLGLKGEENENTKRVREFVDVIKEKVDIEVEFVDERFTTVEAKRMEGSSSLDEKAAMLILQTYVKG
ncbi:Holliday junction resolvase RuvX [Candidatus Parcubacteria bacterium]|nr:MAG: Holliday junction resolvase RuvX [Candidatus Parcubacteria bacterium]